MAPSPSARLFDQLVGRLQTLLLVLNAVVRVANLRLGLALDVIRAALQLVEAPENLVDLAVGVRRVSLLLIARIVQPLLKRFPQLGEKLRVLLAHLVQQVLRVSFRVVLVLQVLQGHSRLGQRWHGRAAHCCRRAELQLVGRLYEGWTGRFVFLG